MHIAMMRRLMTVSVFMALIAATLAVPQNFDEHSTIYNPVALQPRTNNPNQESGNNNNSCTCVPYYQCENETLIDDGRYLIDIRKTGICKDYLTTCCKFPDVVTPENTTTQRPRTRRGCGQRNTNGVSFRIIGNRNNEAQFAEYPWMVAIIRIETNGTNVENSEIYLCGGSLIHPRAVLTAAHCVKWEERSKLKIRAGEWDTQTTNERFPHQDRYVQRVVIHENFDHHYFRNDIAILKLKTSFYLAENVDVACLPQSTENFDRIRCFASGWGKRNFGEKNRLQAILKSIDLPIIPLDECRTFLQANRLGLNLNLDESLICAGGEAGKDTCTGDGGGPLVCPLENNSTRYVQAGIVCAGIGCGRNQVPGFYVNVAFFREWIDSRMAENNLDTTVYQA